MTAEAVPDVLCRKDKNTVFGMLSRHWPLEQRILPAIHDDDDEAEKLLASISRFTAKVNESLQALLDVGVLSGQDGKFIAEMVGTLTLLSEQADSYLQYMQTSAKEHADSYSRHRKEAWEKIQMLLGAR